MPLRKIWILAEPECFFLPFLVDLLAKRQVVAGIIEIHFKRTFMSRLRSLFRMLEFLGLGAFSSVIIDYLWVRIKDISCAEDVYSLRKVARKHGLALHRCLGFNDQILEGIFRDQINDAPVLVQVKRLVPAFLTDNYLLINKHCSILPRYAGLYPIFWTMLAKEAEQGVTIHRMDRAYDNGPILAQAKIHDQGTFFDNYAMLYELTADLLTTLVRQNGYSLSPLGLNAVMPEHYVGMPTVADRKMFKSKGLRFGSPLLSLKSRKQKQ